MTSTNKETKHIAIIGGGPSGLFLYKMLIAAGRHFEIEIFEKSGELGNGMPYSQNGANKEHITNVSDNEIPQIETTIPEWVRQLSPETLQEFGLDAENFNQYNVLPRLLFGKYLEEQFRLLQVKAKKAGLNTQVHLNCIVKDIQDEPDRKKVQVVTDRLGTRQFDAVVICTGHCWPKKHEGKIPGYYDSPYPPSKLRLKIDHPVAIRGSSLTAIDAIKTLARSNGTFEVNDDGKLVFVPNEESKKFRMVLHSRNGMLPAIRFHLDQPRLSADSLLTEEEIAAKRRENNGFLSLDYVFDTSFKAGFKTKQPDVYKKIKNMKMESFVSMVMDMREGKEAFQLFREEFAEAEKSIRERKSVYWKELLAELSFVMNYPAKYLSAEDRIRLDKVLMPLISVVIAFVPQSASLELLALNDAGVLDIVSVGEESSVEPQEEGGVLYKNKDEKGKSHRHTYKTFVNCVGQPHFGFEEFPFKSLLERRSISPAYIRFQSAECGQEEAEAENPNVIRNEQGDYFLKVPGISINDNFQIVNEYSAANDRVYIMAVPYIGGYNPDYSGLDFCEQAATTIARTLAE